MGSVLFLGRRDWSVSGWIWLTVFEALSRKLKEGSPGLARRLDQEVNLVYSDWADLDTPDLRRILGAAESLVRESLGVDAPEDPKRLRVVMEELRQLVDQLAQHLRDQDSH